MKTVIIIIALLILSIQSASAEDFTILEVPEHSFNVSVVGRKLNAIQFGEFVDSLSAKETAKFSITFNITGYMSCTELEEFLGSRIIKKLDKVCSKGGDNGKT